MTFILWTKTVLQNILHKRNKVIQGWVDMRVKSTRIYWIFAWPIPALNDEWQQTQPQQLCRSICLSTVYMQTAINGTCGPLPIITAKRKWSFGMVRKDTATTVMLRNTNGEQCVFFLGQYQILLHMVWQHKWRYKRFLSLQKFSSESLRKIIRLNVKPP